MRFPETVFSPPLREAAARHTVRDLARRLLAEAAPGAGFAMGLIENIPRNDTMVPLTRAVWDFGKIPIEQDVPPARRERRRKAARNFTDLG